MKYADVIMKSAVERLLFESNIKRSEISVATGVGQNVLGNYANGKSDINNMTFANMKKLYKYQMKIEERSMKIITVKKVKNYEHIKGEGWSKEYINNQHLDFLDEIEAEFVDAKDFLAVENLKVGNYILENGDFNYHVKIKNEDDRKMSREEAFGRAMGVLDKISERHFEKGKPKAALKYQLDFDRKPMTVFFRAHKDVLDYAYKFDAIDIALMDRINNYIGTMEPHDYSDKPLDPVYLICISKEIVEINELIKNKELY